MLWRIRTRRHTPYDRGHTLMTRPRGPISALPLAYYLVAHTGLAWALVILVIEPSLPGPSFYHGRMIALVHALTIAWITGSILGSFYIVAPLALRLELPVGRADWIAFAAFAAGAPGMIAHFWIDRYDGMAWSAGLVTATLAYVGARAWRGLPKAVAPRGVKLHIALAFANILAAAALGILIGANRGRGFLTMPALGALFAHAHLAAIGWAVMMAVGLSYRLVPMILPAPMPGGRSIALSAVLIELGLAMLMVALLADPSWHAVAALLIVGGLVSFALHVRHAAAQRLPRPPALPRRDWSTWQAHAAFVWLLIAAVTGTILSLDLAGKYRLETMWVYGIAGLFGFLAQLVTGMQGRLMPMYAWYRTAAADGKPPEVAANAVPTPRFALPIFLCWMLGVPALVYALTAENTGVLRAAAIVLLAGVILGGWYLVWMLHATRGRRSLQPLPPAPGDPAAQTHPSLSGRSRPSPTGS
jgi:hypothetical protein